MSTFKQASEDIAWFGFVCFDSLCPSQQFFSHVGMGILGLTSIKQRIKCLAQGHKAVSPVRLEPETLQSPVKHSTTGILRHCMDDESLKFPTS